MWRAVTFVLFLILGDDEINIIFTFTKRISMSAVYIESKFFKGAPRTPLPNIEMGPPSSSKTSKRQKRTNEEITTTTIIIDTPSPQEPSSSSPVVKKSIIVSAIDPAPENMAIAQWRDGVFQEAGRSLHVTQDGRMFEYKEGNITQLTFQWVMAHKNLWKDSEFIYIEGQFAVRKGRERACLLVRMALESIFLTLYALGMGPKPVCEVATWWKSRVGVEIGGSDHDGNKLRAIEVFRNHPESGGEAAILALKRKFGDKIDDPIEARLMCLALKDEVPSLRERKDKFPSDHKQHGDKKRFSEEERWFPILTHPESDPMTHRAAYAAFKKKRSGERKDKRKKNLLQKIFNSRK